MSPHTIVIRECRPNDAPHVGEVVQKAYLSNVTDSWINALTREVTFQLIVMAAAIMFIFVGVPLLYCLAAIPLVMLSIYAVIYASFFMKATEVVHGKKPLQCWVAEACEPFFFAGGPQTVSHQIVAEQKLWDNNIDVGNCQRKIIGTVAIMQHLYSENSAWLFRLAVDKNYRHKGVGEALVCTAKSWCRSKRFDNLQLAINSKCDRCTTSI